MRSIHKPKTRVERRYRRHLRIRKKIRGTAARPRLVVSRSIRHVYAQVIDDDAGRTLVAVSDQMKDIKINDSGKIATSFAVGKLLGERAIAAGVTEVVFDRGGFPYHGRVKAVAQGARDGGLEF